MLLFLAACDGTDSPADLPGVGPGCWTAYTDADADGYGDPDSGTEMCEGDAGYASLVSDASDCDDGDAAVHPNASELCNGADDNCDGTSDEEPVSDAVAWYTDLDGDGYGDPTSVTIACDAPTGGVTDAGDCDDADPAISPAALEVCDDLFDNNCDSRVDETTGYIYWVQPAAGVLADGEIASWNVLGCDGGVECPIVSFTRTGGTSSPDFVGAADMFEAGGSSPADVYWDGGLPYVALDGPVGGTVKWTFTPASAFGIEGLRVVVGVAGTGGTGEGPVSLTSDVELETIGTYDAYGGGYPTFTWPDFISGSADSELADGYRFFALDADAESVTFTITDTGSTADTHGHALGYVLSSPCSGD